MTFDLDRFVAAQATSWPNALAELTAGAKRSHWMWWIFPQIAGLGQSPTTRRYAIVSADEARAYLVHPLLGPRLRTATRALLAAHGDARDILGSIDAIKLRSSMTLFAAVAEDDTDFDAVIDRFFAGERDGETLRRL